METNTRLYVAYGSNLNMGQMAVRCPGAIPVATARIKGYRLAFKGSKTGAYLTIEKASRKFVPVVVWKVTERDEKNLDRYEGYPAFYYKRNLKLELFDLIDGKSLGVHDTFVYIMDETRQYGVPSDRYFDICLEGYHRFGMDLDYIDEAYEYSFAKAPAISRYKAVM